MIRKMMAIMLKAVANLDGQAYEANFVILNTSKDQAAVNCSALRHFAP